MIPGWWWMRWRRAGVHSARYAGAGATDADRYRKPLDALTGVPWDRRTVRFAARWRWRRRTGGAHGRRRVRGDHRVRAGGEQRVRLRPGLRPPGGRCDYGAVHPEVKNRISHRGRAAQAAVGVLAEMLAD